MGINQIPEGWKETIISDVADVNELSVGNNYPYQQIEYIDISSVGTREVLSTQKLNLADAPSRAKRIIRDNDILISTVRPNLKHFCFIKKAKPNHVASTGFAVISSKKCDPVFLYYLLTTNEYTDFLIKIADSQTSTYPAFNSGVISNSILAFPPLPEQKAIAEVLSSFDNKIELLREQNKTLEAIAQSIFNEWFVRFNFPDENGKSYQASGGKMIDSELGPIPEGWRVGKIKEFGEIICGKTPSKEKQDYFGGETPFIKIPDMHNQVFITETEDSLTELGALTQNNKHIPENSICVSCIATVGLVSIASKKSQTNQQINSIVPASQKSLEYLFFVLRNMKDDLLAMGSGGSATLNINTSTFSNIRVRVPEEIILEQYHFKVTASFKKMKLNNVQMQNLSILRDELLLKLMKGKIRVLL